MAAAIGARHVSTIENNLLCARVMREYIAHNGLEQRVTLLDKQVDDINEKDFSNKVCTFS